VHRTGILTLPGFNITVRCTLCLVWGTVFLSILSVRCTLSEKGFTFCKGETFKTPHQRQRCEMFVVIAVNRVLEVQRTVTS